MPALPGECNLNGFQAAQILEKVAISGEVSYAQVRGVSSCLSYLYSLKTGTVSSNWKRVKETLSGFHPNDFEQSKSLKPTRIPTVEALKKAFTKEWSADCGMVFAKWLTGYICCWCWCVFGCRTTCDFESLKNSVVHAINHRDGWASTAYKGGRNKLPGKKSGTRPWNCFFVCMCPDGNHQMPPAGWECSIRPDGNVQEQPPFCTVCPLNLLEIKRRDAQPVRNFKLFSKWSKTPRAWASNHGKPVTIAMEWLVAQGVSAPEGYDTNAGRKACAAILEAVEATLPEGFEIHGDNPDVWIENYQPSLEFVDFKRREQSRSPRIATKALRMWAHYCGRSRKPKIPSRFDSLGTRLLARYFQSQGMGDVVEECVELQRKQDQEGE